MLRRRQSWSQMLGIQHFWNILVHYIQVEKLLLLIYLEVFNADFISLSVTLMVVQ